MSFKLGRVVLLTLLTVSMLAMVSIPLLVAQAQNDPLPIIDAAYRDLSARLGKSIVRGGDSTYGWEQDVYGDTSLGCPQPDKVYTQVLTSGYKITITYNGVVYDYRATLDGSNLFLCSPTGLAPGSTLAPTVAPATSSAFPPFGPYNLFLNYSLAFVAADGNVAVRNPGAANTTNGAMLTTDSTLQSTFPFNWPTKFYSNLRVSPDGKKLAWVGNAGDATNMAYLSIGGNPAQQVASGVGVDLTIAWSPDGSKLAYAIPTGQIEDNSHIYQLQAVPITATGVSSPEYAGTLKFAVGCGGGSPDAADAHYSLDTGFGGQAIMLEWTDKGFIHSTECSGVGLALTSPSGERLWTVQSVSRAKLSPDRLRLVAIQQSETFGPFLVVIDAATGTVTSLRSPDAPTTGITNFPQQVGWTFDSKDILYASESTPTTVRGTEGNAVGQQLFSGNWPGETRSRVITFWRTTPTAGATPIKLLERTGRGIGTISAAPDNVSVAVSFFTDATSMVQRINSGANAAEALQAAPYSSIIRVWLDGGEQPETFGTGRSPVFIAGQFVANPVPLTQPSSGGSGSSSAPPSDAAAPALVIGGKALVTTTGTDPLNLRESPSRSALVKRILKQGTIVDVIAGPQSAEGFRWWQVRADDGSIGWVVDQVTDETGTLINTLSPTQ